MKSGHLQIHAHQEYLDFCLLCQAERSCSIWDRSKDGYQIVRCRVCKLIYVNPRDGLGEISKQYLEDRTSPIRYYMKTAQADAHNFHKRLDRVERLLPGKGKILDIGCSVGTFLKCAAERGWDAHGVEANGRAVQICREQGLKVKHRLFDEEFLRDHKECYDVVALNDSIEHFPDPLKTMKQVFQTVKKGGLVALSTPNFADVLARVFQVKPREHIFYFDRKTLARMLKAAGFHTELLIATGRLRDIGAMHEGATLRPHWLWLSKALRRVKIDRVVARGIQKVFRDELFAIGRRPRG